MTGTRSKNDIVQDLRDALRRKAEAELSVILLTNELNELHVQDASPIIEVTENSSTTTRGSATIYEIAGFYPGDKVRRLKVKPAERELVGTADRSRVTRYYPENLILVSRAGE